MMARRAHAMKGKRLVCTSPYQVGYRRSGPERERKLDLFALNPPQKRCLSGAPAPPKGMTG
jgi:hypothetical protein